MARLETGGGSEYSPDIQKVFDYLKKLLADGKKLDLSLDEIKKKAKTPKVLNATVSALIKREQKNLAILRQRYHSMKEKENN